ncbi:50S ribosomal protein L19 [Candidatus Peregrinibacteria bacterium]|nr:50S ribosomal protein L19 [Candidatus Peregrinibacteria bacterium]
MLELLKIFESEAKSKKVPEIRSGYTVRVHQKIVEGNKERIQIFEGLIIKVGSGTGVNRTFTVRKVVENVGVEKVFPLYSPNIVKIEVVKIAQVRRARLYYMRERFGKVARLKERHVSIKDDKKGEISKGKASPVEKLLNE